MLQTGLGASVFAGGFPGASMPVAAGATPSGPRTIGQQAFGIVAGDTGGNVSLYAVVGGGALALAGLVFIWWSLPR
jgi:hypothetical protein